MRSTLLLAFMALMLISCSGGSSGGGGGGVEVDEGKPWGDAPYFETDAGVVIPSQALLLEDGWLVTGQIPAGMYLPDGSELVVESDSAILLKYDLEGALLWMMPAKGAEESGFTSVAVAADGSIYAAGYQNGDSEYDYGGVTAKADYAAGYSATLVKYDSSGKAQWAKTVNNGNSGSKFNSVAVSSDGSIYVAGYQGGSGEFDYGVAKATANYVGGHSATLVKYDAAGNAILARTVNGGGAGSMFNSVAVGNDGSIYAAGHQYGSGKFDYGGATAQLTGYTGSHNIVLVKYDNLGAAQWANTLNGDAAISMFNSVAVSDDGNAVYAAGYQYASSSYDYGDGNIISGGYSNGSNSVLVKYDAGNGETLWAKTVNGANVKSGFNSVAVDSDGAVYVAGYQIGDGTLDYGNGVNVAADLGMPGESSIVLVKYDADGNAMWGSAARGTVVFYFASVAISSGENVYIASIQKIISGYYITSYNIFVSAYNKGTGKAGTELDISNLPIMSSFVFNSVKVDNDGNSYAAGFLMYGGTYKYEGGEAMADHFGLNALLIKYSPNGKVLWARTVNRGENDSRFFSLAISSDGKDIYVAGAQYGSGKFDYGDGAAIAAGNANAENAVLVKYDSDGNAQWAKSVEQSDNGALFYSVSISEDGKAVYAAGRQVGNGVFDYGNGVTVASDYAGENGSAVLVKYDSSGTARWARTAKGGDDMSWFNSVAVGNDGSVYVAGAQYGDAKFNYDGKTAQGSGVDQRNAVLVKYDPEGNAQWATAPAGDGSRSGFNSVAAGSNDGVYVSGYQSGDGEFDYNGAIAKAGNANAENAVLVKYDSAGVGEWAKTVVSSEAPSVFNSVALGADGSVYAVGSQADGTFDYGNGATATTGNGFDYNALLVKYDAVGNAQWAKTVKGAIISWIYSVAINDSGRLSTVGYQYGNEMFEYDMGVSIAGKVPIDSNGNGFNGIVLSFYPE